MNWEWLLIISALTVWTTVNFYFTNCNVVQADKLLTLKDKLMSFNYLREILKDGEEQKKLSMLRYSEIVDLQRVFDNEIKRRGILKPKF